MNRTRMAAASLAAAGILGASAVTASAHPHRSWTTTCAGAVTGTVGNVVVKDGGNCWIRNARVNGSVTVEGTGRLVIDHSAVAGNISIASGASFVAVRESSTGDISGGSGAFNYNRIVGLFLEKANVGSLNYSVYNSYVGAHEVTFRGAVTVTSPSGSFDNVEINGDLTTSNLYSTAFLLRLGKIHGQANFGSSVVCGSKFDKDVNVRGALPIFGTNGSTCGGNRVKGRLTYESYHDNHAPRAALVSGNVVDGLATGSGNGMGPIAGSGNWFRGGVAGSFVNLPYAYVNDVPAVDYSTARQAAQEVRNAAH